MKNKIIYGITIGVIGVMLDDLGRKACELQSLLLEIHVLEFHSCPS